MRGGHPQGRAQRPWQGGQWCHCEKGPGPSLREQGRSQHHVTSWSLRQVPSLLWACEMEQASLLPPWDRLRNKCVIETMALCKCYLHVGSKQCRICTIHSVYVCVTYECVFVCMCECRCMCECEYVYDVCIYVYVCNCICVCISMYVCSSVCICVCMYVYVSVCMYVSVCISVYVCMCEYMCVCLCMSICVHVCECMYV